MSICWSFEELNRDFLLMNLRCPEEATLGYITYATPLEIIQEARGQFSGEDWVAQALQSLQVENAKLDGEISELAHDESYDTNRYFIEHEQEYYEGRLLVLRPLLSPKPDREAVKARAAALLAEFNAIDPVRIAAMNALEGNSEVVRAARATYFDLAQQLGRLVEAAGQVHQDWWAVLIGDLLESLPQAA